MKLYRRHIASGAFDNAAEYPSGAPFEAGDGFEWVEGDPQEYAQIYRDVPLVDRLTVIVATLPDEAFSDPSLVAFLGGAKELIAHDRLDALKLAIANLPEELAPVKKAVLDEIDSAELSKG